MHTKTNLTFKMTSLTPQHRRSTRTKRQPKRFTEEKFVSGIIDYYRRGYDGMYEEGSRTADMEDYEKDFCGRNQYSYGGDYTETLMEFARIMRGRGIVLPDVITEKIGSYMNIPYSDRHPSIISKDEAFIADDDEIDEIGLEDDHIITDGEYDTSDSEDSWCASDSSDSDEEEEDCNDWYSSNPKESDSCIKDKSPQRLVFNDKIEEFDTWSTKEYNRLNYDFYDAIRRRDRADNNWRRMIMRVYAPLLR